MTKYNIFEEFLKDLTFRQRMLHKWYNLLITIRLETENFIYRLKEKTK